MTATDVLPNLQTASRFVVRQVFKAIGNDGRLVLAFAIALDALQDR